MDILQKSLGSNLWQHEGKVIVPKRNLVCYAPLWHPQLNSSPFNAWDLVTPGTLAWTVVGATWGTQGRTFDATDDWLVHATKANFDWMHGAVDAAGFQWTVLVWVKLTNPKSDTAYYFWDTCDGQSQLNIGLHLSFDDRSAISASRRLRMFIMRGVTAQTVVELISANDVYPNDTAFHLVAFTYNQARASGNAKIYVDSSLVATGNKTGNTPSSATSTYTPHIGISGSEVNFPFGGVIGEMTILRQELLLPEITNYGLATQWRYK